MARTEPSDSVVVTVSASSVVSNRNCIVQAVALTPAAASCTVELYDPPYGTTTTTGATLKVVIGAAAAGGTTDLASDSGIQFNNGCVAVVAGAGAQATVVFAKI